MFRIDEALIFYLTDWSFSSGVRKPFCLENISKSESEAVFVKYFVCIGVECLEVVGPNFIVSLAVPNEKSNRLCLVVSSGRALRCIGDIHVVKMFAKFYLASDKLEASSVEYYVVDKLFVGVLMEMVCLCLFPRTMFVWQCPFLVHSARSGF